VCVQDPAAPASPWTLDSRFAGKPAKALSPAKQLARQAALQGKVGEGQPANADQSTMQRRLATNGRSVQGAAGTEM
jgi:hypothetical protein